MRYANQEAMKISRQILQQEEMIDYTIIKDEDRKTYGWESTSNWEKIPENGIKQKTGISSIHAPSLKGADSVY